METGLHLGLCIVALLVLANPSHAEERLLGATLRFELGEADLTSAHEATLDELSRRYPPASYVYSFEGDHDLTPYWRQTPAASRRLNERLAETRWQNVARYLGVPPYGLVRATGETLVRVYVEARSDALQDSLLVLRRELDEIRGQRRRPVATESEQPAPVTAQPETVFSVVRFEGFHTRSDKWLDRRWWESSGGFELGLLRTDPMGCGRMSGATLTMQIGSPAYHAFEMSTRLDLFRLGNERWGVTPAFRWVDWELRMHFGADPAADRAVASQSNPNYVLGLDVDARPWNGSLVRLKYVGVGAPVHAPTRPVSSFDQYDFQLTQSLSRSWRLEIRGIYDERFKKSLVYAGAWIGHRWPLLLGEFTASLGFVEQLDALAATTGRRREDPISTASIAFAWTRKPTTIR